jgi:hypothetical protein
MLGKQITSIAKTGYTFTHPGVLMTLNGEFGGIELQNPNRELELARILNAGGRVISGLATAEKDGKAIKLFIARNPTARMTKDIVAYQKYLERYLSKAA